MALFDHVLDPPSYGYTRDGQFYRPSHREIFAEFFRRLNLFQNKKNWLPFLGWSLTLSMALPLSVFLIYYFSFSLFALAFVYSMVLMGSHGTFWLHRYSTHRAFSFSNPVVRFICRNLVIKIVPEEVYVVSHHVHHHASEKPGDPYNVKGGWLYCFLADANHQLISRILNETQYAQVSQLLRDSVTHINSYEQYKRWGSICHPAWTVLHFLLNWSFWYAVFYSVGGHALATALFGSAGVWGIGVRTFNYEGHGRGKMRQRDGIDFYRDDLSINQAWPGIVAGEWHNNHHLFPSSAQCGFTRTQIDFPWYFIAFLTKLGQVKTVLNDKDRFLKRYYLPYLNSLKTTPPSHDVPAIKST